MTMSKAHDLRKLIAHGESETLEPRRSTAELKRAGETRCAFLNGDGTKPRPPGRHQVGTKSAPSPYHVQVLELADVPRALAELMGPSARTDRTKFRDQVVAPLLEAGLLERTIPDKPRSSKQQYRITAAGRALLRGGA